MSSTRPTIPRKPTVPGLARALRNHSTLHSIPESDAPQSRRRASITLAAGKGLNLGPKTQRTSKVSKKLVNLPSEPQTKPLDEETHASPPHHHRTEAERMGKTERERHGYRRFTAYSVAEGFRIKALAAFVKREHGVAPRIFDEAIYAAYYLPLLPGYAANVNIRSSAPTKSPGTRDMLAKMTESEDYGYDGTYFRPAEVSLESRDGYISSSPQQTRYRPQRMTESETEAEVDTATETEGEDTPLQRRPPSNSVPPRVSTPSRNAGQAIRAQTVFEDQMAEVVVFDYGVVVLRGMEEAQERAVLEDFQNAGLCLRPRDEDDWEIEQCHYVYDPSITFPRIYNDFFTFKSPSHLLTLSIAHALAQSTLLAHYESTAQTVLLSPQTLSIPRQLAATGHLKLRRAEALRLTGKLFKLRRDVNLVSNVLDTPELFWSEASLKGLYDACREYFEISPRVQVLNDRLTVASDLLDIIHEHLNTGAMDKITWIVIWLIVVACLVELGEVLARLFIHGAGKSTARLAQQCINLAAKQSISPLLQPSIKVLSEVEVLGALERILSS